ncbi:hypothetical protein GCM10010272_42540 [Streptomyces lateritius]|nr:hypothetical protein GCM10010272_42540 [Streptomyces lateritius]
MRVEENERGGDPGPHGQGVVVEDPADHREPTVLMQRFRVMGDDGGRQREAGHPSNCPWVETRAYPDERAPHCGDRGEEIGGVAVRRRLHPRDRTENGGSQVLAHTVFLTPFLALVP